MIDFHSHILPEIDDGSRNYEESQALLKEAKSVGFESIISTSHYAIDCYEVPEYKRKELIEELKTESDSPNLYLGSEIFLTYNIAQLLEEYKASTINGTNYILIELPLKGTFVDLEKLIINLHEKNYNIILAHPERYQCVQKNYKILYKFIDMGLILQSNYASILGYYGFSAKLTVKKMLKEGLVSLLGTDVHRKETIYPLVPKALEKIAKYVSKEDLDDMTTNNAKAILEGAIFE